MATTANRRELRAAADWAMARRDALWAEYMDAVAAADAARAAVGAAWHRIGRMRRADSIAAATADAHAADAVRDAAVAAQYAADTAYAAAAIAAIAAVSALCASDDAYWDARDAADAASAADAAELTMAYAAADAADAAPPAVCADGDCADPPLCILGGRAAYCRNHEPRAAEWLGYAWPRAVDAINPELSQYRDYVSVYLF